jgi:hypothetical protein
VVLREDDGELGLTANAVDGDNRFTQV